MIAVKRLQSLFWIVLVAFGALGAYLVSLRVATERNDLMRIRTHIAMARADIRYLETEFAARASMRQLEKWNAQDFRYATPTAAQYLAGERALASLDGVQPNGPEYVAAPVMVAMVEAPSVDPVAPAAPVVPPSPAATQIRSDMSIIRAAQAKTEVAPVLVKQASAVKAAARARPVDPAEPSAIARRTERMAMLDAKLLDDSTLGDLTATAARERRKDQR